MPSLQDLRPSLRLAKRLVESVFASEADEIEAMRPRFFEEDLGRRDAFEKPEEAPQATQSGVEPAKPAEPEFPVPQTTDTPWYMDGEDLDGWEDTNANDEKKAEARESADSSE